MYRRLLLALALLLPTLTAYCQIEVTKQRILQPTITPPKSTSKNEKLDYNNGFREYHFGQDFAVHADELKLISQDGSSKFYERKSENLKAGYVTLTNINYVFTNNKLAVIILKLKGQTDSDMMKLALFDQYGYTDEESYSPGRYEWRGQKVSLSFNTATLDKETAQVMYVGLAN